MHKVPGIFQSFQIIIGYLHVQFCQTQQDMHIQLPPHLHAKQKCRQPSLVSDGVYHSPPSRHDAKRTSIEFFIIMVIHTATGFGIQILHATVIKHTTLVAIGEQLIGLYSIITIGKAETVQPQLILQMNRSQHTFLHHPAGASESFSQAECVLGVVVERESTITFLLECPAIITPWINPVGHPSHHFLLGRHFLILKRICRHTIHPMLVHHSQHPLRTVWCQLHIIIQHQNDIRVNFTIFQCSLCHHTFLHPHIFLSPNLERRTFKPLGYVYNHLVWLKRLLKHTLQLPLQHLGILPQCSNGN